MSAACGSTALWLTDFRNYAIADARASHRGSPSCMGANGQGKTNLLEAIGYLATLASFRGAPTEALVRAGAARGGRAGRGPSARAASC